MKTIDTRELRQHASEHLRRVEAGAVLKVTARGRTVALLIPARRAGRRERLIAQGRLAPAAGDLLISARRWCGHPASGGRASNWPIQLDDDLLDDAVTLDVGVLRSLDAIHLAAARTLGDEMTAVVTYDWRLASAADVLGLVVEAPR